jgi:branched-chain amino acid transport system ATP-binding protein
VLKVENVSAFYGEFQALNDITLDVKSGQTTIVLGPNGAGKTTLLKSICGLEKIRSGAIHFENERIDTKDAHKIAEMGIALVPEGGRLFPSLSVYENLKIGAYLQKPHPEREGKTDCRLHERRRETNACRGEKPDVKTQDPDT